MNYVEIARKVGLLWNGVWQVDEAKFRAAIELATQPHRYPLPPSHQNAISRAIHEAAPGVQYHIEASINDANDWTVRLESRCTTDQAVAVAKAVESARTFGTRVRVFLQGQEIRYEERQF